jgi:TolB-like protein/Tfp pilus assembly protein PilF
MVTSTAPVSQADFILGDWLVQPDLNQASRNGTPTRLEPKAMQVLVCLVQRAPEVVTKEQLLNEVWPDTFVGDQVLATAIWQLRQALGNGGGRSEVIETIPKRGYRLVAAVSTIPKNMAAEPDPALKGKARTTLGRVTAVALLVTLAAAATWWRLHSNGRITSIAVLPLANYSSDPDQEYFADGVTEELTTDLSHIDSIRVISRTSTERYKGTKKPLPEIGRELGVDALVEGSVQRSGERVRITVQLIQARTEKHLWAESYERKAGDLLTLRAEIASAVMREIRATVSPRARKALEQARNVPPEAHEVYLLGWSYASKGNFEKSIEYYQRAIQIYPDYVLAHAEMAESLANLDFVPERRSANYDKAVVAANRALELDPDLSEALLRFADLKFYFDWEWSECDKGFRRARDVDPGSSDARYHYGLCLSQLGRDEEALPEMERYRELDPLVPRPYLQLGMILRHLGRLDQAIEQMKKGIELNPDNPRLFERIGLFYTEAHRNADAAAAYTRAKTLRGHTEDAERLRLAYQSSYEAFRSEYERQRRAALEKQLAQFQKDGSRPFAIATLYVELGEKDKAFEWLEKAYRSRSPMLTQLKAALAWDPVRSDPRYAAMLRRINLPEN